MKNCILTLILLVGSTVVFAQKPPASETWMTGMDDAVNMFDKRGFLKDKARTIDGNVSIARANGNVQYRHDLASYTVNGAPINVSMNFNQNAEWTTFRSFDYSTQTWNRLSQNRPVWMIGVNGFAVQALTYTSRSALHWSNRKSFPPYGAEYNEDDQIYLLDGYDYSNRMINVSHPATNSEFVDVIRLLREDGSVLELVHQEQKCGADADTDFEPLYTGTYATTDANSHAFALVKIDHELLTNDDEQKLIAQLDQSIPRYLLPRVVEYFPGDGYTYVFYEYTLPFGTYPVTNYDNVPYTTETSHIPSGAGYHDASPTIFYLGEIRYNGVVVTQLDYTNRQRQLRSRHVNLKRGRGQLTNVGQDLSVSYEAKGVLINFRGKQTHFSYDADHSMGTGLVSNPQLSHFTNDLNSYEGGPFFTWTPMIGEITDPELRVTKITYENVRKALIKGTFPNNVTSVEPDNLNIGSGYSQKTVMLATVPRIHKVKQPICSYEISYHNVNWRKEVTNQDAYADVSGVFTAQNVHVDYIYDATMAQSANGLLPYANAYESQMATILMKYDRNLTNSGNVTSTTPRLMWTEAFGYPSAVTTVDPVQTSTSSIRTTYSDGTNVVSSMAIKEDFYRYTKSVPYYPFVAGQPRKLITHSIRGKSQTEFDMPGPNPQTVTEENYSYVETETVGGITIPKWRENKLLLGETLTQTCVKNGQSPVTCHQRTREVYSYTVDNNFTLPYEDGESCSGRSDEFHLSYGNPIKTRHTQNFVYDGSTWIARTEQRDTFLNVSPVEVPASSKGLVGSYDERRAQFEIYWNEERTDPLTEKVIKQSFGRTAPDSAWSTYMLASLPDVNEDPVLTSRIGVLKSTATRTSGSPSVIEGWTSYTYDLSTTHTHLGVSLPNPSYVKQLSSTQYGRKLNRWLYSSNTYCVDYAYYDYRSRLESTTSPIGQQTQLFYDGDGATLYVPGTGQTSWITNGQVSAKRVSNAESLVSKTSNVSKSLSTHRSHALELPTHSKRRVRKPYLVLGSGIIDENYWLPQVTGYDDAGFPEFMIDENGYLSSYEYDNIGRIRMLWLPHDFPDLSSGQLLPPYSSETSRRYEPSIRRGLNCGSNWVKVTCYAYGDPQIDEYVCDPFDPYFAECYCSPGSAIPEAYPGFEIVKSSIVGYLNFERPACPNEVSAPYGGGNPTTSEMAYPKEVKMGQSYKFFYPKSEHVTLTSAKVKLSIVQTFGVNDCFNFEVIVKNGSGNVIASSPVLSVYCNTYVPDEPGTSNCGPEMFNCGQMIVHPGQNSTGYRTYHADVSIDLQNALNSMTSVPSPTGEDLQELLVEVRRVGNAYGVIELGNVHLEVAGQFRKWNDRDDSDFTLAMFRNENNGHTVGLYTKIDDRSQANDESTYPTTPSGLYTRHRKAKITFTTDDLVQKEEHNYSANTMNILAAGAISGTTGVISTYDGAGNVHTTTNARGNITANGYDPTGRQLSSVTDAANNQWVDIEAANPVLATGHDAQLQTEIRYGTVQEFGIPVAVANRFISPYCRREVSRQLIEQDGTTHQYWHSSAVFFDALDRKVLTVSGYNAATFTSDLSLPVSANVDVNLATWYYYDGLDRVIKVLNPLGQEIHTDYDDFGNVRATSQTDMGVVSHSYNKLGQLRYSQTEEQAAERKLTYRQYDDLGRPTVIGEAKLNSALTGEGEASSIPGVAARLTSLLSGDVLRAIGSPTSTCNRSIYNGPIRPVPSIYKHMLNPNSPPNAEAKLVALDDVCNQPYLLSTADRFNPPVPPGAEWMMRHQSQMYARPVVEATYTNFENIAVYPEFVLQAIWYDELPSTIGAVWGNSPPTTVWNALAPTNLVRNLKGRPSIVAYRTHGGQPFHYTVRSYDERGRVEAQLRLTENIGFDGVYYKYNSSNKIVSIHVVDATGQHATFYAYDEQGRVSKMWTKRTEDGYGNAINPAIPTLCTIQATTDVPDAIYTYDAADAVATVSYPKV
ncbi:MAG TPA: hypothetical protein PLW14_10355, partial [Chlorobiota bacterium]|nr:hypothetical protein [Chlorobiota bacterium]